MEEERFATELLKEVKNNARRFFIAFIITLILLFASNMAWLYAWSLPVEDTEVEKSIIESNDDGNASYINGNGDINNGKDNSN